MKTIAKHSALDSHKPNTTNSALAQAQARPRWTPLVEVPNFNPTAHHVDYLAANGVKVGIVNGVCCIKLEDTTRAAQLLAPAR